MNGTDPEEPPNPVPSIRHLRIERFHGIEKLEWRPASGLNVIVGPGDSCKSTILEAIGALLSPAPHMNVSEFDYFRREIDKGFEIEAVLAVGDASILNTEKFPLPPLRGWRKGQLADLPGEGGAEAVIVCRLTGTPDQEAIYEVIGADEETRGPFSRALRQRIGLMRLGIADRRDRDLRACAISRSSRPVIFSLLMDFSEKVATEHTMLGHRDGGNGRVKRPPESLNRSCSRLMLGRCRPANGGHARDEE